MVVSLEEVISQIDQLDDPKNRKRTLPGDELIKRYEEATGYKFPEDYRVFLKNVSNAFVGFVSPFFLDEDLTDEPGGLIAGISDARRTGLPKDWLPICEDNGDYYCIAPDGAVRFWDHSGSTDEAWPDLATWAKEVWLNGL